MQLDFKTLIGIRNNILGNMQNPLSKIEGTYDYDIAAATALEIKDLYDYLEWWSKQTFIDTATENEYVDKHALIFGVQRRSEVKASGEITITGKTGTTIPEGTVVLSRIGVKYETLALALIGSDGKAKARVQALVGGITGNCGIGDIVAFEIADTNIYTVTNEEAITGGFDIESNESLIARAEEKIMRPAHSGNENDYKQWAKEVEGVGKVDVIPVWNGGGTVKVIISDYDYNVANQELVEAVKNRIEQADGRPIGANVTVVSYIKYDLDIVATIKIASGYDIETIEQDITADIKKGIINNTIQYTSNSKTTIVSIGKVGTIILSVDGVLDYTSLSVNGETTGNIEVPRDKIVVLNNVEIMQGVR
jgi:uncharacterized phage protein gp47/JayE